MSGVVPAQPVTEEVLSVEIEGEPSDAATVAAALTRTLPERGLDRMSASMIESALCTSALTAHI